MNDKIKIAVYIRTATEDTGNSIDAINGISNQHITINSFLDKHSEFANCQRVEFVDNGFSGLTADRPSFTEMLKSIESGEIQVVCVQSFDRFFRDIANTDKYINKVLPLFGVRFISVIGEYDSCIAPYGSLDVLAKSLMGSICISDKIKNVTLS